MSPVNVFINVSDTNFSGDGGWRCEIEETHGKNTRYNLFDIGIYQVSLKDIS